MTLPTEDDVLAFLVLKSAMGQLMRAELGVGAELGALQGAWQETMRYDVSTSLHAVALERQEAHGLIVAEAIAETERLWEVERARDAVVDAATQWFRDYWHCLPGAIPTAATDRALWYHVRALEAAEAVR